MELISADFQIKDAINSGMLENDLSKNNGFPASNSSNNPLRCPISISTNLPKSPSKANFYELYMIFQKLGR